jgi:hypothetical protein
MNIIIVIINILELNGKKKDSYFIHVDAHGSFIGLAYYQGP